MLLEETGEVLGVFEAEGVGGLCVVVGVVEVEIILCYHAAKLLLFTQIVAPKVKKDKFGKYSVDSDNRRKRIFSYLCTR